jgi:hypothetical protein
MKFSIRFILFWVMPLVAVVFAFISCRQYSVAFLGALLWISAVTLKSMKIV